MVFVPELPPSHIRTGGPGGEPEATEILYLCSSSSITIEADVLTIKQAAESMSTGNSFVLFFTCVEHLLDDHGHLSLQHGVEQLDDEDEAGAEDDQRRSQENEAHRQVWQISIGEDVFACNGRSKR